MSPVGQIDGKIEAEGELYLSNEFWKKLEETFSESPIFDDLERILQEPEPLDWYSIREYPLSEARKNFKINDFDGEGDIILVISYTGKAEIKFDSPNADSFDLETYKKIKHTYTDIYLTNEAQEDATIKILFGRGDWEITDTVAEIDLSGAIRNDQLDQITDPLKIGQIIRDSHIVPHADIACEKILITGTTRLEDWRSAEDYTYIDPGRILLHAATTLSDWRHPTDLTLIHGGQIFTHSIEADKLSILTHILSGATWDDHSPAFGSVEWTDAQITYNGHTYDITDGDTALAYIWWDLDNPTVFQTSPVKPALTDDDCIVCYNNAGTHELVWNATLIEGRTIRTGSITTDEIMALTIIAGNIAADAITTVKLNAFAVTTGKINALAVTTAKIAADAVIAAKIDVIGLNGATGRIVVGDITDADEVTAGVNAFATTLILPGKIVIDGATNLEDWRKGGDLTEIDGGRISTNTVTATQISVVGLDVNGRIVIADATDADEVTGGINNHATTLILPGKIVISGGTNLEDWRAAGNLTLIDGGDIFANSVTAVQAQFDDLINVSNLFTLAAGRVVISKNAFGANLEGILINDTIRNRVEIGELTAGNYGITIKDSTGERTMLGGDVRSTTRFNVNRNALQPNIVNATMTKVLLNAEWFDPGNNFAGARFTAPRDGYYFFQGQIAWTDMLADQAANARLMEGGAAGTRLASGVGVFNSSPNQYAIALVSTLVWLDSGDYVELFGIHWQGDNNPDIYGWAGRGETFLAGHYIWGGT